jgi:acyl carrier protein
MSDILDRLVQVVVTNPDLAKLSISADKVVPEASFRDDLGASSVIIFDLILAIEDEFGIEVPDEDAIQITTVGDAVQYLEKRLG